MGDYEETNKTIEKCKQRSLKILGSRQMSTHEMQKRLVQKGETEENAKETVKWLETIGAINDIDFAEAIVRYYINKGYGIVRVKDELYKRGIHRDLWDDALTVADQSETDDAVIMFLDRKLRGSRDRDDVRKSTEALCRRGFSYEEARMAVTRYLENAGNTERTEQAGVRLHDGER